MTPHELVEALLAAPDAAARRALLAAHAPEFYVAVAGQLKDRVDRERLRCPGAALRIAALAAEVADVAALPRCQALADWARANVLLHQGEYTDCLRLYRRAALVFEAQGAEIEAARLVANQAWALKNLGRYAEGVQTAQAALAVLRQHPPSAFLASALNGLGTLYRLLGRYDEALAAYAECEQVYTTLGDRVQQARLAVNRSNVLRRLDRFGEAIRLLQGARAVLAEHERSLEVARVDLNLGIIHTRLGRYDDALEALNRAEKGFIALDNRMEAAVVELYRAELYADFNLYAELLSTSARDWDLFEERQMQWHAARATLHQAVAWRRLGDPAQAEALLDLAQAAFARIGDPVWARLAGLERAALWCDLGEPARALPVAAESAAWLRERRMPVWAAGGSLLAAQCCLALGQPAEAAGHYREVLALADAPTLHYRAHHGLGRVAEQQGDLQAADEHFRQAVEKVESLRQRLRVDEFRLGFLEDKLHLYRDAVLLCLRLGRQEEAFAYVERAKSAALVDLLLASLIRLPSPEDAAGQELVARLTALREQLNWRSRRLEGEGEEQRGPEGRPPEAAVRSQVAALEWEMAHAWREFQRIHPFYATLSQPDRCTLAAVQTCLRRDEVLVQYYLAGEAVYAFVVGPDGLRACLPLACPPAQVEAAVEALHTTQRSVPGFDESYVADALGPLCRQQLGWLYDDLLRPLAPFFQGADRLLIAPDGVLFEVPFHALHDGNGYLLERYQVACIPSVRALRLCQENHRRRTAGGRPLVVGCSRRGTLPHIWREVEAVARVLPGAATLTGEEATLARLQQQARGSALLHLATHAVFRSDNPLFSALQLAGGDWLRVMDLYSLQLDGALVTLSGCETGRHRRLGGDLLGLSRGFFYAGAAALVASLWPVDDAATALLMEQFYTHLAAGETAASALRRAQQAVRDLEEERDGRRVRPYAHPFYWAAFCLLGAPEVGLAR